MALGRSLVSSSRQLVARTTLVSARYQSTDSSSYEGSKNYVPGKQGYAPGFPPPKNWRAEPRAKPLPLVASDLPKPKPAISRAKPTAATEFRQKMRELRHEYLHDHLVVQQEKREVQKKNLQLMRQVHKERKEKIQRERQVYETQVRSDPLSAENVLNAEGLTLLGNVPELKSVDQPGYDLKPPKVSISMPVEANRLRDQERAQNRRLAKQYRHEDNVQAMMTLFHDAQGFITYENLNRKITEFLDVLAPSPRGLGEMLAELNKNGGNATNQDVSDRTSQLRNMLMGTTGKHGKLGYNGLVNWLDSHPEDADGIIHADSKKKTLD
ncbi:hypothetical protein H4R99_001213 [Coemansia sp. RSA 1722]|nr:hypothetical protein LPJ57_000525 [Coemansia sp. RSA 486]KAJ2237255.1 hypothetical protein IWW45_001130 [Coemansia sp. RSA 485]KAJ2601420.1 hypothetical protein GGF39_001267 [Coemansia sp. RSA 1721]KAJ2605354.1 hypothetical protein H4R99_001213 [Coemansia sp. RSA 1722]KAJ2638799.1 hypothetical protein GGF40_001397 [Coemansia sp. RSA 1286]